MGEGVDHGAQHGGVAHEFGVGGGVHRGGADVGQGGEVFRPARAFQFARLAQPVGDGDGGGVLSVGQHFQHCAENNLVAFVVEIVRQQSGIFGGGEEVVVEQQRPEQGTLRVNRVGRLRLRPHPLKIRRLHYRRAVTLPRRPPVP